MAVPLARWPLVLPLLASAALYLPTASSRAILDSDDACYSSVAKEMVERGDWITPYTNGVRFLQKPPLMFWMLAASFSVFGVNEFAAHLPGALGVLATVWVLGRMARRAAGAEAGLIAGLAFALSIGTLLFTVEALLDIALVFFLTLSMGAFLAWYLDPRRPLGPALLFYASLAGALLSRSLIGVFFPVAIVGVFLLLSKERLKLRDLHIGPGALVFLALGAPWHLLAAWRNPGFLRFFFLNEQVLRFFQQREPKDFESVPVPLFWILLLVWFFPWSAFLPAIAFLPKALAGGDTAARALVRLAFIWAGVVLIFFSVSARLEHYAFPVLPPLALLAGVAFTAPQPSPSLRRALRWGFTGLAILALLLCMIASVGIPWLMKSAGPRTIKSYDTDFGPLGDLPPETWRRLAWPAAGAMASLLIGCGAAWLLARRNKIIPAVLSVAGAALATGYMIFLSLGVTEDLISSKKFALAIASQARSGDRMIVAGNYDTANSTIFYAPLPLEVYGGFAHDLNHGLSYPDAPRRLLSRADLDAAWRGPGRVFLIAAGGGGSALKLDPWFAGLEIQGRVLASNQPLR